MLMDSFRWAQKELLPSELLTKVLEDTGYLEQLQNADTSEADARLENLQELRGSLMEFEAECLQKAEEASLSGYLERVSLVAAVDTMQAEPSVSLMTVHSAKGLEFDTVWLIGMEEEVFPYKGLSDDNIEDLDEERRLAYVAVTRARRKLYASHTQVRNLFGQTRYLLPSRFLSDLPNDVVSFQGIKRRLGPASFRPHERRAERAPGERFIDTDLADEIPEYE
jgi:DNA helicase-2/ATP-dependent DNA helicase PcrA